MAEEAGGGAELAVGYVSARVKFGEGEKDVVAQFEKIGKQADETGKVIGSNIEAGMSGGVARASTDAVKALEKTGSDGGEKLSQGIVGAIAGASSKASGAAEKTGAAIGAGVTKGATKDASKLGEGVLAGLDTSKASQAGARFGEAIGGTIGKALSSVGDLVQRVTDAHLSNVDRLQNKYEDLGVSIGNARAELQRMNDENGAAAGVLRGGSGFGGAAAADLEANVPHNYAQLADSSAQIAAMEEEQKSVKAAIAEAGKTLTVAGAAHEATELGDHIKEAGEKAKEAAEHVKDLGGAGGEAAEKLGGIAGALGGLLADPVVLVGAALIGLAASAATVLDTLYNLGDTWEETFNKIAVQTGATGEQMEGLEKSVTGIAGNIALPIEQIGGDVASVTQQFGDTGADLDKVTTAVGRMQTLFGNFNLNEIGKGFKLFGVEGAGPQVSELTNLMHAYQLTGTSIDQFAANVQATGPVAKAFNLNYDQTVGILTSFEKSGLDGAKVMTALSHAQGILAKGTKGNAKKGIVAVAGIEDPVELNKQLTETLDKAKQLQAVGDAQGATSVLENLFGKPTPGRTGPVDYILQAIKNINPADLTAPLKTIGGSVDDLYKKTTTVASSWQEMKNGIIVALKPASEAVHSYVSGELQQFVGWIGTHKKEIVDFFVDIGVAGVNMAKAGVEGFGEILSAAGQLTNKIGSTIGVFADLADAVGAHGTADNLRGIATSLQNAGDGMDDFGKKSKTWVDEQAPKLIAALEGARDAANEVTPSVGAAAGSAFNFANALKGIAPKTVAEVSTPGLDDADAKATHLKGILDGLKGTTSGTAIPSLDGATAPWLTLLNGDDNHPLIGTQHDGPVLTPNNNGIPTLHKAAGGSIPGPGVVGKDSVPIMAAPGEHMWTADEVSDVGGQGAMYHLRAMARAGLLAGMAYGGVVQGLSGGGEVSGQAALASRIYSAILAAGYDEETAVAGVQASLLESGLNPDITNASQHHGLFQESSDKPSNGADEQISWLIGEMNSHGGPSVAAAKGGQNFFADNIERGGYPGSNYSQFLSQAKSLIAQGGGVTGDVAGGRNAPSAAAIQAANDNVTKASGAVDVATQKLNEAQNAPLSVNQDGTLSKGTQAAHDKRVSSAQAALDAAKRDLDSANEKKANLLDGTDTAAVTRAQNAVTDATNRQADAQAKLDKIQSDPNAKPSEITKAQNDLAMATTKVAEAKQKLTDAQNKAPSKKDQKDDPLSVLGTAGADFLKGNLLPGMSDPTTWPGVKIAAGLLKFGAGFVKNPIGKGLLNIGGSALGGDGAGVATGLEGLLRPASLGDAPGADDSPVGLGGSPGASIDPSAFIPHIPTPGDPTGTGTNVDSHDDHSTTINGNPDSATKDAAQAASYIKQRVQTPKQLQQA